MCSNCIHKDICYRHTGWCECPNDCENYKDERKFIESPVAIGDTIYIRVRTDKKDPSKFFISSVTVTGLHLRDEEGYRKIKRMQYLVVRTEYGMAQHIPFDWIGTRVFFTLEEAKKG